MNTATTIPSDDGRSATVWAAQVVLFLAFGVLGLMKLLMPIEDLARIMTWPGAVPPALVRFIGAAEVAGAIGVMLPSALGILPRTTVYAAFGLMTVMIGALGYHLMLFQGLMLLPTALLGALAAYVGVRHMR